MIEQYTNKVEQIKTFLEDSSEPWTVEMLNSELEYNLNQITLAVEANALHEPEYILSKLAIDRIYSVYEKWRDGKGLMNNGY